MSCLVHHEWRLKCEKSKCRIVEVVRVLNRQCLQQCTVPRRQPAEFMERVALGSFFLYLLEVPDIPLGTKLGQIHELVCGHREVEKLKGLTARTDNGDHMFAAAKALRKVCTQLSAQTLQL